MIFSRWPTAFKNLYGGMLPRDYVTTDIETTGFSRDKDLIVQWGHCVVEDGKPVDRIGVVLNWFDLPGINADWLSSKLRYTAGKMREGGKDWGISEELLRDVGVHPLKALTWIYELLAETKRQQLLHVIHRGWTFDIPVLAASFQQYLQKPLHFADNAVFDTAAVVKADQLLPNPRALPLPGETLKMYFSRINGWRQAGLKSNLDDYCVGKYKLPADADMHDAGTDAYMLHLLMEKLREEEVAVPVRVATTRPAPPVLAVPARPPQAGLVNYRRQRIT